MQFTFDKKKIKINLSSIVTLEHFDYVYTQTIPASQDVRIRTYIFF